jgi:hypothetical protein
VSLRIIKRSDWLDFKPRSRTPASHKGKPHVVHYYGSAPANPPTTTKGGIDLCRSFASYHLSLGWSDIGYNFIILRDGQGDGLCTVLEGRGDNVRGAHAGHNTANGYAGVMLLMSHTSGPSKQQLATLRELTRIKGWGKRTGHMEWSPTSCPGPEMMAWIRANRFDAQTSGLGIIAPGVYAFEEVPWEPSTGGGGNGPAVRAFTSKAKRDRALAQIKDAGGVVTPHSDGNTYYLYHWRPGTYNKTFRFGPWESRASRDSLASNREKATGRQMRRFSGGRSLYPYWGRK